LKAPYATGEPFERAVDFAMHVINDDAAPLEAKLRMARVLLPFQEARIGSVRGPGKKEQAQEAAEAISSGPYAPPQQPRKPN
jgi:hypothetical protein